MTKTEFLENYESFLMRLKASKNSLYNFVKIYFPNYLTAPSCRFHIDSYDLLSDGIPNKRLCVKAPRGHAKTTIYAQFYPLWSILFQDKKYVVIFGNSQTAAEAKLNDIVEELESNQLLRLDYQIFTNKLVPAKDSKGQYRKFTDGQVIFESGIVLSAKGIGVTARGLKHLNKRPDVVLLDDMQKDEDVERATVRDRHKYWFDNVIMNLAGHTQACDIIIVDTVKHYDALIMHVGHKTEFKTLEYPAIMDDKPLWDSKFVMHVDQMTKFEKDNWNKRNTKGFETIRTPYYGQLISDDESKTIIGKAEGENSLSFTQEYLLKPLQQDAMPLRSELWNYFKFDEELKEIYYKGNVIPLSQTKVILGLDPSTGVRGSDYQAICVIAKHNLNYYLLQGYLKRLNLVDGGRGQDSLSFLLSKLCFKFNAIGIVVENNGMQGLFLQSLNSMFKKHNVNSKILTKRNKTNKIERITGGLGIIMQSGKFIIRDDWQHVYRDFMYQFDYFPSYSHDDAPDVCNTVIDVIKKLR